MKRLKLISAFVLAAALILGVNAASAVSIGVKPNNQLQSTAAAACMNSALNTTTDSANHLVVNNINASCFGKKITVQTLSNSSASAVIASVTVNASSVTSTTVISNPSDVTGVYGFIDGWFVPTMWNYQAPATPAYIPAGTSPTVTVAPSWSQANSSQNCATFTVTSTSTTAVPWQLALNTTVPPYNGDTNPTHYSIQYGYGLVSNTPTSGIFYVTGTLSSTNTVKAGSPQSFYVCNYLAPAPAVSSNVTYTVTKTSGNNTPSYYPCKTINVSVTGAPQFYVGWEAVVDMADIKAAYIPGGGSLQGPYGDYSRTLVGGTTWKITGTGWLTAGVRDGESQSFQVCWAF